MLNKQADPQAAWNSDKGSYLNTVNPFSNFFGLTDKVPGWWMDMFPKGDERAAYMTFKTGACALLAAGLFGGYRVIRHLDRVSDMAEADNPAGKLRSQLSTTFSGKMAPDSRFLIKNRKAIGKKRRTNQDPRFADLGELNVDNPTDEFAKVASGEEKAADKPAETPAAPAPQPGQLQLPILSWPNAFSMALPLGASILAASLAYKGVDEIAGARRNRLLDKSLKAKSEAVKALMTARARIAKGNATPQEIDEANAAISNEDIYMKQASLAKAAQQGTKERITDSAANTARTLLTSSVATTGLLASLMVMASALGSYEYFKSSNENNIRYKAMKKGLKEYAKQKTSLTPISTVPTDTSEYFRHIDEAPEGEEKTRVAAIKNLPEIDSSGLNKPISITL